MSFKLTSICAALALFVLGSNQALATENGLVTYPVGVNTVLNGILPEPGGTRFYNYTTYYEASKFVGGDGNSAIPGFHVSAFVNAARIVHTWNTSVGPFTVSSGAILPLVNLSLTVPGASGSKTAIGDVIAEPLLLGYMSEDHTLFAHVAPLDIGLPTGSYDRKSVANTGNNYYAFLPSLNVTWFAAPGWELSATGVLQLSSKNADTNYQSGNVAMLDYNIGYSVAPKWQLGIQGSYLKQFSDDLVNGNVVADGFRGQAMSIGPQVRYDWAKGSGIAFKLQNEFGVQNRAMGTHFWVQFSMPY